MGNKTVSTAVSRDSYNKRYVLGFISQNWYGGVFPFPRMLDLSISCIPIIWYSR